MKVNGLLNGMVIVLQRDVENPEADRRRVRSLSYAATWNQGTRLLVKVNRKGDVRLEASEGYSSIDEGHDGFMKIVHACEPAERNLRDMLWAARELPSVTRAGDILESLVELGILTLDQVAVGITHNFDKEMARVDA